MVKGANEEDGGRVEPHWIEWPRRNFDREWNLYERCPPRGPRDGVEVTLGEDDDSVEAITGRPFVSLPGCSFEAAREALRPTCCLQQVAGPPRRWIMVDKDRRQVSSRRSVHILRHCLQMDLDDFRLPCIQQELQGRRELGTPTVHGPRGQTPQHSGG